MDKGPHQAASSSQQQQQRPTQLPPTQLPLPPPQPQQHQQYPFQQQPQGTWTPSLAAPPFYPGAFYSQNGAPTPQQQPPHPQQYPYGTPAAFDPANAQLAQWAYQQMMFNAQHGHMTPSPQQLHPQQQQTDFFAPPPGMHGAFNPFPSGTPPPRPNDAPQPQYAGFHPYRRPSRQQSGHSEASVASQHMQQPRGQEDWRPQPPYSRGDASGSSSSVNSQGRARTNSNNSQRAANAGPGPGSSHSHKSHSPSPVPSTKGSPTSSPAQSTGSRDNRDAPGGPPRIPHHRAGSSSSTHSAHSTASGSGSDRPSPASLGSSSSSAARNAHARPSPLSQGTVTASSSHPSSSSPSSSASAARPTARSPLATSSTTPAASTSRTERRMSRDDSSLALSSLSLLATRADTAASAAGGKEPHAKGSGLKGRLRRALSFNAAVALKEEVGGGDDEEGEGEDGDGEGTEAAGSDSEESIKASVVNPKNAVGTRTPALITNTTRRGVTASSSMPAPSPSTSTSTSYSNFSATPGSSAQQIPMPKKKSRAASLFNSRLNASTDNISLSSTVSSASVMIRKLGSMGRLARRNSLAGITGLFKKKGGEGEGGEGETDGEGAEAGAAAGTKKKRGKDKEKEKDGKKKDKGDKKSKTGKAEASEASVSHATAELEAGDWSVPHSFDNSVGGAGGAALSPAAKLARQHTLKSNAEAAAKAREAAAARAAAAAVTAANAANGSGVNGGGGVPTWERNTTTRSPGRQQGSGQGRSVIGEDGTRVFVEEGSGSEDEGYGPPPPQSQHAQQAQQSQYGAPQQTWAEEDEGEDSDEGWGLLGGEEDDTIRIGDAAHPDEEGYEGAEGEHEHEPWAVDVRRSVERTRVPARGILKHAGTYDQSSYLPDAHPSHPSQAALRHRSNSYNSPHGHQNTELGPLARIPSPDPDHIDGLHRHGSHSSAHGGAVHGRDAESAATNEAAVASAMGAKRSSVPSLPPLSFELGLDGAFDSPQATPTAATYAAASGAGVAPTSSAAANTVFAHPAFNSSAPALTSFASPHASPVPRAATAPAAKKHLAFASNLSVYDTFSASMYDRRSEPATWSRLTPALAQRIKEELNSYKMEEMEVHAASRIHTQFFV
ncbi:hypothetical protein C8R46DRAFT_1286461 [Mycena filopes]|nr:hypothetical protein C8R46DRAFT_1286461 [Mycena filopes]